MYFWLFFLYKTLASASPIDSAPSPDPVPSINSIGAASSIASYMASPSFLSYTRPTEDVAEWIALGDSFTAGTGCNGNNEVVAGDAIRGKRSAPMQMKDDTDAWEFINTQGGGPPARFSFSAYTGDTTELLITDQLKEGPYTETNFNLPRHPFGSPQLAIMTIGGNDAYLADIIINCLYQPYIGGDCDGATKKLKDDLASGALKDKISYALFSTAIFGRQHGSAKPSNSFQVYVSEYIPYFDETTTACNDYTWNWWFTRTKLTQELRRELNGLTVQVNQVIKEVATELQPFGVIFVSGIADQYISGGHQFCAPGHDSNVEMTDTDTWFWSQYFPTGSTDEGRAAGSSSFNDTVLQPMLDFAYGKGKTTPQDYPNSPLFNALDASPYKTFNDLIDAMGKSPEQEYALASLMVKRSMHPKGTAFGIHKDAFMAAIADNRGANTAAKTSDAPSAASASPAPSSSPPPAKDICGDWYKVLFDSFEIFGKNFDESKLGKDGSGLKDNLNGCGAMTNYHFETLTNDPNGYQWKAYGNLPIGTKACVGRALVSAGGDSPDGCTGSG